MSPRTAADHDACWRFTVRRRAGASAASKGLSSNEEMQLTKPDGSLVGGRGDHVRCRRAIVFESGFAADLRCSTNRETSLGSDETNDS